MGDNGNKVTSGWCWVSKTLEWNDQVLWMLLAGKLWEIIAYFVIVVLYALIKRNMTKEIQHRDGRLAQSTVVQAQKVERRLICVPLIFVFLRIWGTIRFILSVAHGPDYISGKLFLYLQAIGDNAPGFANFLLFCFFTEKCLGQFRWYIACCRNRLRRNIYRSSSSTMYCDEVTPEEPLIQ